MTHWCRDIPRDEAVRAAEDNRQGPLPTLEAVIAGPFADSRGASDWERLRADADHLLRLVHGQTEDFAEVLSVTARIDARVGRLEAMMAKNRLGSSAVEPDAWGVRRNGMVDCVTHRQMRSMAERSVEQFGGTVVPLYAAPQPAPGWLTPEERGSIQLAANIAKASLSYSLAQELENILGRSTPPEVVS